MTDEAKGSGERSAKLNRRKFLETATAATAGMMFLKPELVRGTEANSAVRVGLLGCGGRGTEDAANLVDTGGARVVALADMFQDQLNKARAHFDEMQKAKGFAALDSKQLFVGPKRTNKSLRPKKWTRLSSRRLPISTLNISKPPWPRASTFIAKSRLPSMSRALSRSSKSASARKGSSASTSDSRSAIVRPSSNWFAAFTRGRCAKSFAA